MIYVGGKVETNLIMAKTRIAPKRKVPVDKLELNAALIGVRLTLRRECVSSMPAGSSGQTTLA